MLRETNLDGDRQADLSVHGGPNKAVYGYPSEHYELLAEGTSATRNCPGALSARISRPRACSKRNVSMGDHYRVGSAVITGDDPAASLLQTGGQVSNATT